MSAATGESSVVGVLREHASSVLVATLASAFGVSLLEVTGVLAQAIGADPVTGGSSTVAVMLSLVAIVFIVIALYVGAVVTANSFSTIIAGRVRTVALLRLIGAGSRSLRLSISREGLAVGALGALLGFGLGSLAAWGIVEGAIAAFDLPRLPYALLSPVLAAPVVAVVLTTWAAAWSGSRRVLSVTPVEATGGAQEIRLEELGRRAGRNGVAIAFGLLGAALLAGGVVVGLVNPAGVLIGVLGGVLSFTGIVLAAPVIMPRVLRMLAPLAGRSVSARVAAGNALRYPERSARTTIGLVIGVTLVTMLGVVAESFRSMILAARELQPETYYGVEDTLGIVVAVFGALLGFSAILSAVGLVNSLSLSVLQRTRELGLLRALGLSIRQLRGMIAAESLLLAAAAVLFGLVLGGVYGWAGAQSLLGSTVGSLIVPSVPWLLVLSLVLAAVVLAVAAALVPARRAARLAPVEALAMP